MNRFTDAIVLWRGECWSLCPWCLVLITVAKLRLGQILKLIIVYGPADDAINNKIALEGKQDSPPIL